MKGGFDRTTWQRLWHLARPFFVSEIRWRARGLLLLLVSFSLAITGINYLISVAMGGFMNAFWLRQKAEFFKQLYYCLLVFGIATPLVVFYRYTEERLGLAWRRWLSHRILHQYFQHRSYFKLSYFEGIDNPDQRIAEDVRSFCATSLSILLIMTNSVVALFVFTGVLWNISVLLVFAVLLYATIGSLITYFVGKPLIDLTFNQLKKEADFRFKLVDIRENVESIAFYQDESIEEAGVRQRLKDALDNLLRIINWNRNLGCFTTGYNYLIGILSTILMAPLFLDGKITIAQVVQGGIAFGQVLGALNIIVTNFGVLFSYGAVIRRLGAFLEAIEAGQASEVIFPGATIQRQESADGITFENVTIFTPHRDQTLIKNLSFFLADGQSLFITGASGTGKSALFRVIARLCGAGEGRIVSPDVTRLMFLPQRPYLVLGSFRNQLLYGVGIKDLSEQILQKVLRKVQLEQLLDRMGGFEAVRDWPNVLSLGEQQRLAFARLLLTKRKYGFMDEATTALDATSERLLYNYLQEQGTNFISLGSQASLEALHTFKLELRNGGQWGFSQITEGSGRNLPIGQ